MFFISFSSCNFCLWNCFLATCGIYRKYCCISFLGFFSWYCRKAGNFLVMELKSYKYIFKIIKYLQSICIGNRFDIKRKNHKTKFNGLVQFDLKSSVYQLYNELQIFDILCNDWLQVHLSPTLELIGCLISISLLYILIVCHDQFKFIIETGMIGILLLLMFVYVLMLEKGSIYTNVDFWWNVKASRNIEHD